MVRMSVEDRRAQLVDAAIEVMTRDGVPRATTRAIVAEAGASLSVFHYCFGSKRDLFEEVVRTIVDRSAALAREALRTTQGDADPVRASLMAYWDHVTAHPAQHLLTYEVTQYCLRHAELAEVAKVQYEHYAGVIAEHLLTSLPDARQDVAPAVVARYLAVVIDGLTLDWLVRRDDAQALAVLDTVSSHVNAMLA
ncbi:TetR/AcrR family transcriptional regulator [Nocardioides jishulii]|uniref:TetR/AcrR family transcriptional regulator n=1 Tax=Nocardioides jishulii TaxID=2575440 RepID=A0A4U2YHC8_9ACTN|nr:TetR/AcrR family transcriptional regulator [Nocardioides jishulii]QCX26642.1 TetR/AcrR family transcriptional regulator [Nocardioides jishulii]TKI60389.1 TetR/AcrR family transcriptional regulator [Nocardioides jishulii]